MLGKRRVGVTNERWHKEGLCGDGIVPYRDGSGGYTNLQTCTGGKMAQNHTHTAYQCQFPSFGIMLSLCNM